MIIEKYYTVADTAVCIAADEKIMYGDDGVLAPFALASVSGGVVRYEYEISDSLPDPCGTPTVSRPDIAEFGEGEHTVRYIGAVANSLDGAYICTRKEGSTVRVTVKSSFCSKLSPSLILNSVSAERLAVNAGGIIFHSAYIGFRNEGILFTAPSGTGKSTQAELWRKWREADVINGDRSLGDKQERKSPAQSDSLSRTGADRHARADKGRTSLLPYMGGLLRQHMEPRGA